MRNLSHIDNVVARDIIREKKLRRFHVYTKRGEEWIAYRENGVVVRQLLLGN